VKARYHWRYCAKLRQWKYDLSLILKVTLQNIIIEVSIDQASLHSNFWAVVML
jgi:hypothetical protein